MVWASLVCVLQPIVSVSATFARLVALDRFLLKILWAPRGRVLTLLRNLR